MVKNMDTSKKDDKKLRGGTKNKSRLKKCSSKGYFKRNLKYVEKISFDSYYDCTRSVYSCWPKGNGPEDA